jgi:flagellar hook assembly protein FlgD
MTRPARAVFAALVVATFAAFFVAQRLKNAPAVVQRFRAVPVFSPNQDGRFERAVVSFRLKRPDSVIVAVVDSDGDEVRELLSRDTPAYRAVRAKWDGRDDSGARVPDGLYRYRLTLQRQGRTIVFPRSVRLDTRPPRPRVLSIGPQRSTVPRPELLPVPGGGDATIRVFAPGRRPRVSVFKTAPGRPRRVVDLLPLRIAAATATGIARWDGRLADGRRASPGTYVVGVEVRDSAGNVGRSPAHARNRAPVAGYGSRLPGRGGITVRYLGAAAPAGPTAAGARATFAVDARARRFAWRIRRVGADRVARRGIRERGGPLRVRVPGTTGGVFLFEVNTRDRRVRVPFAVEGTRTRPVLVVVPVMTWQGRNPVDDDGDGAPDVLDRGVAVRLDRVYAGDGLPQGFAEREAPMLAWLARTRRRFDVTTDFALARGRGPRLEGHRGVLLAGDTRWLTRGLQARLRRYVRRGGRLASLGVDSLRRQVRLTPAGRLASPTPPATADVFGARIRPLRRASGVSLTNERDEIGLFEGTSGAFTGFGRFEPTSSVGPEARLVASAVPQPGAEPVIVAVRSGRGLVIRFGLPELASRLGDDDDASQAQALLTRTWTLLSR